MSVQLHRQGIRMRGLSLDQRQVDEATQLYEQGWSVARIGHHIGVDGSTVWRVLRAGDVRSEICRDASGNKAVRASPMQRDRRVEGGKLGLPMAGVSSLPTASAGPRQALHRLVDVLSGFFDLPPCRAAPLAPLCGFASSSARRSGSPGRTPTRSS